MAGQPLKRLRSIKIRVSDAELERLRELCPKAQLAEWMREQCLGVAQPQRRTPSAYRRSGALAAVGRNGQQPEPDRPAR